MAASPRYVVVGVVPGQLASVVTEAACFAEAFDAELICAWVDASRYAVAGDGTEGVTATSIDPDIADDIVEAFPPQQEADIAAVLDGTPVRWSTRALAGGPSQELARLADDLGAVMIVVGTRKPGFRGTIHEFFAGSVAVQLAHHQHRPVVVIPVNPVGPDGDPPWLHASWHD